MEFTHLRTHTEYSISDGLLRIKPWIQAVKASGMTAVAITDRANLFGVVQFYREALAQGIKPIIGADIWLHNDKEPKNPFSITLLCQNNQGYKHLTLLLSKAYLEGQAHGKPAVHRDWLAQYSDGLLVLSGGPEGDVGRALLAEQGDEARQHAGFWQRHFPDRYYLTLQRIGERQDNVYGQKAIALAGALDLPVVATNSVQFLLADDFEAHEARVCIHEGWQLADDRRPHRFTEQQYLRSPKEMHALFVDVPSAIDNAIEITKRCTVSLSLGESFLPNFPVPIGMTVEDFLTQESRQGLDKRFQQLFDGKEGEFQAKRATYDERLTRELSVINRMGFPGYFLIVADFIRWAKENGIPVGPGRGSGAGSLVAYVLGITNLDPLHHGLLFERFLNPERVSMPDFDIDFCMDGRDRVIDYVAEKYGRDSVSQIITFGTMAAKAVVRDVGRVLGLSYLFVDKIAKLVPFELGMTLTKALEDEEALRARYEAEEEVSTLIDLALKLEGVTRNAGKHAGGVVIAPTKLTDFTPLYCEAGSQHIVTQFHKDDVEAVGLVKFDFLGLRTLTIIDWALKTINSSLDKPIDIDAIPVDDSATYDLLKSCQTTAVFQLESRGMKDLVRRLQPDSFEEIVALVALFRPGPLQSGMVDDFIDRKHGRATVTYAHPDLEPILCSTYGVILYQEQVMKIAQVLADYSLGKADILRRAMGKKKPEEMAKQRQVFVDGALGRGTAEDVATYIFDLVEKFAGYGFNKSHSAAYALLAYQTAWLKTHYPAEFMAAVLSSDMDNTDKTVIFVDECRQLSLNILLPNVNQGHYKFTVGKGRELIYGLGAIKGVGEAAVTLLIEEREARGEYRSLFDFCARLDLRKINKRVLEALVKSGAMDVFNEHRARLLASLAKATQAALQYERNQAAGQDDLFATDNTVLPVEIDYVSAKPWREDERLLAEKESLGLYLTGHPIRRYLKELGTFTQGPIVHLRPTHKQTVLVAGLVSAMKTMQTKRGDRMAFVTLDDSSARIEMAVFSESYHLYKGLLVKDKLLVVEGEVSVDEYTGGYKLSCSRLYDIAGAREMFAKHLSLNFNLTQMQQDAVTKLQALLKPFCGGVCPVYVHYQHPDATAKFLLGPAWRVTPHDDLLQALRDEFSEAAVDVVYV